MAIENRALKAGDELVARYKGQEHTVLVLGDEEVGLGFELDGETIYKSLSKAGSAVMNGTACNGWRFWTRKGEEKAPRATTEPKPAEPKEPNARKPKAAKTVLVIKKARSQATAAEGHVKWFCSACQAGFDVEGTATPEACPQGHKREEVDELAPVE